MIKILEVCTASSPAYALVFGRANALNRQYPNRLQIGLLCSEGPEVGLMRQQGMRVIVTGMHRSLNPLRLIQSGWNLYKVLRKEPYDVVHLHFGVPSLVGRTLAFFMRKPLWIYQSHGYSIAENTSKPGKLLYLLVERFLKHTVDLALFQSREDMQLADTYRLLDKHQMLYLGNGIDTERFAPRPVQDDPKLADCGVVRKTTFGMVARFEKIKNHQLLIDAIKYLRLHNRDFRVLLIGQGELQGEIEAQISAHELQQWVEVLPYNNNMPDFYQKIDVGILTSFGEGLPRALLEPMSCGKPVICTDVKGSREAVEHGVTGFTIPLGDPQLLAEKMLWCLSHPQERGAMGQAARQRVLKHFSEQQVLERLGTIYLASTGLEDPTQTAKPQGLESRI